VSENGLRTITVSGKKVGMLGLEAIFAELKAGSRKPSEELGATLVELAGRRNYIAPSARPGYEKALLVEYRRYLGERVPEEGNFELSIKILGQGCHRCETLTSNVRSALAELDLAADVEHVRDVARIGEYGVLGTPALVVNGEVKSIGKTLTTGQIVALLCDDGNASREKG
jgi:small redox-active disulfide protein 2